MTIIKGRVQADSFQIDGIFRIARGSKTAAEVVTVTLSDGTYSGRGECVPYARYGESLTSVCEQIQAILKEIEAGLTREKLQSVMPAGAARNAVDCALWDLEAKREGSRVWELLGLPQPDDLVTAYTISYDDPIIMEQKARDAAARPLLKVKLASSDDVPRIAAVRRGAPQSEIMLDANEGWSAQDYASIMQGLEPYNILAIEQPLPASHDQALKSLPHPIPLIADESAHTSDRLPDLIGLYDMINIKLDKTGGLTEALKLKQKAEEAGMDIMVGCMVGSSLAMAPAMVLAHDAKLVDLDGPLLLSEDRNTPLTFDGSLMKTPSVALWG
ncbi:dipeptide epimerase [Temperatibacter marinus]|uniref:Dipeptide epimerase n=1 Tax=Temperatibacter marinus TaxID=1456591 RepID=A0AA52H9A5_9PROT|nr:N-acetyl-D-Glu racemase DgcA [Temperatibacter marinus]WND01490.1 dipeptide epimerase [Temperatibacter marinus]